MEIGDHVSDLLERGVEVLDSLPDPGTGVWFFDQVGHGGETQACSEDLTYDRLLQVAGDAISLGHQIDLSAQFLSTPAIGFIASDLGKALQITVDIKDRCDDDIGPEPAGILPDSPADIPMLAAEASSRKGLPSATSAAG